MAFGIFFAFGCDMTAGLETFQERSFRFACDVVQLYRQLIRQPDVPHAMARQLLRSGTSIGANLEEAVAAQSRRDIANRFAIALRETRETRYWLRLLAATGLARADLLTAPLQESKELTAILTTAHRKLL
ncbi:MAG TPA: four helix bundle protein [Vicinamibacterales bacterium]|nr:four helix bundle protein [Vicinamibacterales bacterium]